MKNIDNVLTELDEQYLLLNGEPGVIEKKTKIELSYEEKILISDNKMIKEIKSRKILKICLAVAFIPFCIANIVFIGPYKT